MKKIKSIETGIHFSVLSIILSVFLLINGCKKKNTQEEMTLKGNDISLIQSAKNYFTDLVNKEKESPIQSSATEQTKNTHPQSARLLKISPYVLWDNATKQNRDGLEYAIIPLKENIKPFKNKSFEFFRNIIFYQDKIKKANMIILEVLSKKDESLGDNLQKIAITSFENKYFSQTQGIDALNASIIFYNEKYLRDTSFQIQNGKWVPARISFRSDLDIKQ